MMRNLKPTKAQIKARIKYLWSRVAYYEQGEYREYADRAKKLRKLIAELEAQRA